MRMKDFTIMPTRVSFWTRRDKAPFLFFRLASYRSEKASDVIYDIDFGVVVKLNASRHARLQE